MRSAISLQFTIYAYDGNGNVLRTISANDGTETSRNDYGPFGELLRLEGVMAKANPLHFSTKFQDEETWLFCYGYDTWMFRSEGVSCS
jgi:hypothetical protein